MQHRIAAALNFAAWAAEQRMRAAILLLAVTLIGLQVRLWVGMGSMHEIKELEGQISVQTAENDHLRVRNELLRAEVQDLRSNLDSIEERARNELGLIRRGETFFLMVDEAS